MSEVYDIREARVRIGELVAVNEALQARLAEYEEKDGQRTREHNLLVRENRAQAARLAEAERDRAEIMRLWFQDANPGETRFASLYAVFDSSSVFTGREHEPEMNADSATLNMEPCPDGSRVLCVADQPTEQHERFCAVYRGIPGNCDCVKGPK